MLTKNKHRNSPSQWDAIVIGSGMGGLSAAAALSRTGHKVLVLEQYQTIGGLTHSFSRNGYRWDVGIHYLSNFGPGEPDRDLLDWISETPIELESMGAVYDVLHLGDAKPVPLSRPYEAQALDLLPVIREAGGEARADVRVDSILVDKGRAVGVRAEGGNDIDADNVVSSIGARETIDRLPPDDVGEEEWIDDIRSLPSGLCYFSLYLGFEGDIEDAGATKANHWVYPRGEVDAIWDDAPNSRPPGLFVSFASLKDRNHFPGPTQRHSGEILVCTDWSTVAQWANSPRSARGESYAQFEKAVDSRIFEVFEAYFPDLAKLVVFRELATPFATVAVTGHTKGAFYGRDGTPERMLSDALRMRTPIKGLYLAGQDVASQGVPGAMWGGVLCA